MDLNFYVNLKKYLPNDYREILSRLNDLAYDEERWERFKNFTGVQKSLLRSSSAVKARFEAYQLLEGLVGNGIVCLLAIKLKCHIIQK